MLWCSKSDKPIRLKPTRRFSMREYAVEKGREETKRMFFLSLICNVNPDVEFFDVGFQSVLRQPCLVFSRPGSGTELEFVGGFDQDSVL